MVAGTVLLPPILPPYQPIQHIMVLLLSYHTAIELSLLSKNSTEKTRVTRGSITTKLTAFFYHQSYHLTSQSCNLQIVLDVVFSILVHCLATEWYPLAWSGHYFVNNDQLQADLNLAHPSNYLSNNLVYRDSLVFWSLWALSLNNKNFINSLYGFFKPKGSAGLDWLLGETWTMLKLGKLYISGLKAKKLWACLSSKRTETATRNQNFDDKNIFGRIRCWDIFFVLATDADSDRRNYNPVCSSWWPTRFMTPAGS